MVPKRIASIHSMYPSITSAVEAAPVKLTSAVRTSPPEICLFDRAPGRRTWKGLMHRKSKSRSKGTGGRLLFNLAKLFLTLTLCFNIGCIFVTLCHSSLTFSPWPTYGCGSKSKSRVDSIYQGTREPPHKWFDKAPPE